MIRGLLRHLSQNGEWEIRIPFAISRVGTKLYPLSVAEEPDESKDTISPIARFFAMLRMTTWVYGMTQRE